MSIDVERALRDALAARAAQVTPERLQPAVPPTAMPARRSASSFAGRFGWLLATGAAALLVARVVAVHPLGTRPARPGPDRPASSVAPSPSTSSAPVPAPSPSSPPPSASRATSPSRTSPVPDSTRPASRAPGSTPSTSRSTPSTPISSGTAEPTHPSPATHS